MVSPTNLIVYKNKGYRVREQDALTAITHKNNGNEPAPKNAPIYPHSSTPLEGFGLKTRQFFQP
ncbi:MULTISPECIES: hypothetical protein [unclassified Okeania]|uniref:hypothetical protein n=1 Tax=unclassified Okeania TaxID=2634635 RepID=UPI0013C0FCF3|nr:MULTISPECIES: hypothetical protein [unclassified Okeania]NEN92723.1 hypothetical protein [Okeania sp. SIO3H1]NET30084.1 hypothetical protein [Okeania sp. SIO1I7]NET46379.1 hypothetical protein [Okeania sp. SIO2B3]